MYRKAQPVTHDQENEYDEAQKGDFLVIEEQYGLKLDPVYRQITVVGFTLNEIQLIEMAEGIRRSRGDQKDASKISDINMAILVLKDGGWVVLQLLN